MLVVWHWKQDVTSKTRGHLWGQSVPNSVLCHRILALVHYPHYTGRDLCLNGPKGTWLGCIKNPYLIHWNGLWGPGWMSEAMGSMYSHIHYDSFHTHKPVLTSDFSLLSNTSQLSVACLNFEHCYIVPLVSDLKITCTQAHQYPTILWIAT